MATTDTLVDVVMPQMGVSVSEGTVTKWLKSEGEAIEADETLLEISTDKVDTEVPSPATGIVAQVFVQEGETVEVGTKLAVIAPEGAEAPDSGAPPEEPPPAAEAPPPPTAEAPPPAAEVTEPAAEVREPEAEVPEPATQEAAAESAAASGAEGETPTAAPPETPTAAPPEAPTHQPAETPAAPPVETPAAPPAENPTAPPAETPAAPPVESPAPAAQEPPDAAENGTRFVSPVVARIAAEHGVDVAAIPGTGRGGRVTKKDILGFIESGEAPAPEPAEMPAAPTGAPAPSEATAPAPAAARPAEAPAAPAPAPAAAQEGETVEAMSAMRRGIAEHMRRSLDTSAHVTSAIEVDMSRVAAIRQTLKNEYQASHGVNPTYLAFVARAAVDTIDDYPWINGELRGESIVTRSYVNLGFAVELADGKGLIVPVVKNAETLNLLGMAKAIADIAARARDKKLLPEDVQGGTFTITNPGGYGTFHGTPVISQPQAGILGTYAVVKRPWVVRDEIGEDVIAIRSIMNLTLTYDHRIVDGALAGRFLRDLRERLQTWGESDY